jgi:hypothetical protein
LETRHRTQTKTHRKLSVSAWRTPSENWGWIQVNNCRVKYIAKSTNSLVVDGKNLHKRGKVHCYLRCKPHTVMLLEYWYWWMGNWLHVYEKWSFHFYCSFVFSLLRFHPGVNVAIGGNRNLTTRLFGLIVCWNTSPPNWTNLLSINKSNIWSHPVYI